MTVEPDAIIASAPPILVPTAGQEMAMQAIRGFMRQPNRRIMSIDGPAGTGKSQMLSMIRNQFANAVISTPTNKACDVLRRKGFGDVTTVDLVINQTTRSVVQRPMTVSEVSNYTQNGWRMPTGRIVSEVQYKKAPRIDPTQPVVVDESSMLSLAQVKQLSTIAPKIIVVGDAFQLPPVEGGQFFQGLKHDVRLTEIVRTRADSPIAQLAGMLRNRDPGWKTMAWGPVVSIVSPRSVNQAMLLDHDIIIAHRNASCDHYNSLIREYRGLSLPSDRYRPVVGDVLLAWETDHAKVTKGSTYEVLSASPANGGYLVQLAGADETTSICPIAKPNLQCQATKDVTADCLRFSFAHCITGHKSQGSEWERVLVFANDYYKPSSPEFWHWLYTAATRARTHLTIVV